MNRKYERGDVLALILAIVVAMAVLSLPFLPPHHRFIWGFAPSWDCANGNIAPVCQQRSETPSKSN
jgi:hypothetical protein